MKYLSYLLLFITCHAYGQGHITCAVLGCDCSYPLTYNYPLVRGGWNYADGTPMKYPPTIDLLQDTIPGYIHTGGTTIYIPGDSIRVDLLNIRQRKVVVQQLQMGMHVLYVPETDREEGNSINQQTKIITYQIAMDDEITEEQKYEIKQAIDLIMFNSPGVPVVIDTVDAVNSTFVGTWRHAESTTAPWYGGTLSFSNETGTYATYKDPLPYKRIEIWAEKKSTHGIIALSINSGPEIVVDLYSPNYEIPHMVYAFDVPLGVHEIKYRITETKNAASSNYYGLIDFYRIFR